MCIKCRRTPATVSGLLYNYQHPSASTWKESENVKKAWRKASPTAEKLKENARAISVREIKTHYAGLACLGLLLDCQLTARAGWGFPEVQTKGQAGLKNGTYCSPRPDPQRRHWGKTKKNLSVGKGIILYFCRATSERFLQGKWYTWISVCICAHICLNLWVIFDHPASLRTEVSAPTNHQRSTLSYMHLVIAAPIRSIINNFTVEWHWHKWISWPHVTENSNSNLLQETVFHCKKKQFHSIKTSNQMIWQLLGWLHPTATPSSTPYPLPN